MLVNKLDETLQKVGRNVLAYQRLESMLKYLIANCKIEGPVSELQTSLRQNTERVSRKTMGVLVGELDAFLHDGGSVDSQTINEAEWVSIEIEIEPAVLEQMKSDLKDIVESRNRLIHSDLSNLNEASEISMEKLTNSLDEQYDKLLPVYEGVSKIVQRIPEVYRFMANNLGKIDLTEPR